MLFYYVAGVWNNKEGPHTGADRPTGSLECYVLAGTVGLPSDISKTVPSTVPFGPPPHTVDTAIFEMSLGSLSAHQGLAIPVV